MDPRVAFDGVPSVTAIVSASSCRRSLMTAKAMVCVVCPGANVTVPLVNVKSTPPPVAEPPLTEYGTVTV